MKKIIYVASFMMLSVAVFAQHEAGTLSIQPKAGLNIAYYTGSEGVETKPRLGLVAGAEQAQKFTLVVRRGSLFLNTPRI